MHVLFIHGNKSEVLSSYSVHSDFSIQSSELVIRAAGFVAFTHSIATNDNM